MLGPSISPAEFPELFRKQFELCNVKNGETVVLLTNHNTDRELVRAAFAGMQALGAEGFEVGLPKPLDLKKVGHETTGGGSGVMTALKSANLLCPFFPPNLSPWLAECRKAGARVLSICDRPDQLHQLQSPPGLKEAVTHAANRYAATKRVHVSSAAGTDLTFERGAPEWSELRGYYGRADEPGRFDQWGMGMVADFPDEGTANGIVVIKPGDVWILPYVRVVESDIRLDVVDGYIRKIEGGVDAKAFRDWLNRNKRSEGDMDPFAISHLGFGLHPNAHWDDILVYGNSVDHLTMSMRSFPGNFLFSTGPGPHRRTMGHIDMPMCDCTVAFDNDVVIREGKLVDPAMIVASS
jgi:2,5-dihydroxypyridine 5,6-dioxygenase